MCNKLNKIEQYQLECLKDWLTDNINAESTIHFDNEGKVDSEIILSVINKLEANQKTWAWFYLVALSFQGKLFWGEQV